LPTILDRNGAPPKAFFVPILKSNLLVQYGSSFAFQSFHDFLGILRLDSHFFQGDAKVLEEQVEVRVVQTVISGAGMGVMNTFPCIHSSAEEHGNEHSLSGPEVCHVNSLKEMAQAIIMQDLVVEEFSSSLDGAPSPIRSNKSSIMVSSLPMSEIAILRQQRNWMSLQGLEGLQGLFGLTASFCEYRLM